MRYGRMLLAGLFLLQLAYSIHVGGDAWEWWGHGANRFVVVAMPLFFILASLVLFEVAQWLGRWLPDAPRPVREPDS